MNHTTSLCDLPDEVLLLIIERLATKDRIYLSQVDEHYKRVCFDHFSFKKLIDFESYGFTDDIVSEIKKNSRHKNIQTVSFRNCYWLLPKTIEQFCNAVSTSLTSLNLLGLESLGIGSSIVRKLLPKMTQLKSLDITCKKTGDLIFPAKNKDGLDKMLAHLESLHLFCLGSQLGSEYVILQDKTFLFKFTTNLKYLRVSSTLFPESSVTYIKYTRHSTSLGQYWCPPNTKFGKNVSSNIKDNLDNIFIGTRLQLLHQEDKAKDGLQNQVDEVGKHGYMLSCIHSKYKGNEIVGLRIPLCYLFRCDVYEYNQREPFLIEHASKMENLQEFHLIHDRFESIFQAAGPRTRKFTILCKQLSAKEELKIGLVISRWYQLRKLTIAGIPLGTHVKKILKTILQNCTKIEFLSLANIGKTSAVFNAVPEALDGGKALYLRDFRLEQQNFLKLEPTLTSLQQYNCLERVCIITNSGQNIGPDNHIFIGDFIDKCDRLVAFQLFTKRSKKESKSLESYLCNRFVGKGRPALNVVVQQIPLNWDDFSNIYYKMPNVHAEELTVFRDCRL